MSYPGAKFLAAVYPIKHPNQQKGVKPCFLPNIGLL